MINNDITFLLLRLGIAISFFCHGLVRLPKLAKFSSGIIKTFEDSMIPNIMVIPFSYILPIAEFSIGLLLILGLFTKQSLIAGSIVMLLLIFGTTMIENFDALSSQLIHLTFFAVLLSYLQYNNYSVDKKFRKNN